jgi:hypothetical protein
LVTISFSEKAPGEQLGAVNNVLRLHT